MSEDLAARLSVVALWAPRLRAAGVESLHTADLTLTLRPHDPGPLVALDADPEDEPKSLLDDPSSYGLDEGAEVPGFRRPDDLEKS